MFAALVVPGCSVCCFGVCAGVSPARLADLMVLGIVAIGIVLFVELFYSCPRFALVLFVVPFAAAGPMIDLLLRYRRRASVSLVAVSVILSVAMIALWPGKRLRGVFRGEIGGGTLSMALLNCSSTCRKAPSYSMRNRI